MRPLARAALAALAWLAAAAAAQPLRDAGVDELVERLAPRAATRGLDRNVVPEPRQVELVVNFDFDSAALQPSGLPLLARLAQALNAERLRATRFRVEGHTDAVGTADYNQRLSERRARAVVAFLESQGVAGVRLAAEGKGARELLEPADPRAAANRRVRIVALY